MLDDPTVKEMGLNDLFTAAAQEVLGNPEITAAPESKAAGNYAQAHDHSSNGSEDEQPIDQAAKDSPAKRVYKVHSIVAGVFSVAFIAAALVFKYWLPAENWLKDLLSTAFNWNSPEAFGGVLLASMIIGILLLVAAAALFSVVRSQADQESSVGQNGSVNGVASSNNLDAAHNSDAGLAAAPRSEAGLGDGSGVSIEPDSDDEIRSVDSQKSQEDSRPSTLETINRVQ